MAESDDAAGTRRAPLPQLVIELRELIVDYVKQETLIPIRQLGRYILFGIAGSFLLGLGVVLLGVGGLRALQTETGDTFQGDWTWAPYGITVVAMFVGAIFTWKARRVRRDRKEVKETA